MIDWILYITVAFLLFFLIVVAFLYVVRPYWIIVQYDVDSELTDEVDFWKAFIFGLGIASITITWFTMSWMYFYDLNLDYEQFTSIFPNSPSSKLPMNCHWPVSDTSHGNCHHCLRRDEE
jgi:hypothetical protein